MGTGDSKTVADLHRSEAMTPAAWLRVGEDLFAVACHLEPNAMEYWGTAGEQKRTAARFYRVYMMLTGFAFENVFKALIVHRQHEDLDRAYQAKPSKLGLPRVLLSHDLLLLAPEAGLEVTEDRVRDFLARLSRYVEWQGRYPGPVKPERLRMKDILNLDPEHLVCIETFFNGDFAVAQTLYARAMAIVAKRKLLEVHSPDAGAGS